MYLLSISLSLHLPRVITHGSVAAMAVLCSVVVYRGAQEVIRDPTAVENLKKWPADLSDIVVAFPIFTLRSVEVQSHKALPCVSPRPPSIPRPSLKSHTYIKFSINTRSRPIRPSRPLCSHCPSSRHLPLLKVTFANSTLSRLWPPSTSRRGPVCPA